MSSTFGVVCRPYVLLLSLASPALAASDEEPRHPGASEGSSTEATAPTDVESKPLVKQIGLDFKNLFTTRENLWILGGGAAATFLAHRADPSIPKSSFNEELFEDGTLGEVMDPGNALGGAVFQIGAAVTTFAVGKVSSDPGIEALGRDLVRAQILTQGLTQAIKYSVQRTRPDGSSDTSFPSGHAAGTFATATVLQRRFGWKIGIPAYGFASYVAASRLSENKHYLSDVVFGATIGILAGRTVTFGVGGSRFALSPMVVPGGAGVQVSLLH